MGDNTPQEINEPLKVYDTLRDLILSTTPGTSGAAYWFTSANPTMDGQPPKRQFFLGDSITALHRLRDGNVVFDVSPVELCDITVELLKIHTDNEFSEEGFDVEPSEEAPPTTQSDGQQP